MTNPYKPVISSRLADELNGAFASGDPRIICTAIGKALGDFNVSEIARQTGLQRTSIYRAFGNAQLPNFSTVLTVLTAMGLQLRVVPSVIAKTQSPNAKRDKSV